MLGLGGGGLPMAIRALMPHIPVAVCEIEEGLIAGNTLFTHHFPPKFLLFQMLIIIIHVLGLIGLRTVAEKWFGFQQGPMLQAISAEALAFTTVN